MPPIGCIPESAVHWAARNRLVLNRSLQDGHLDVCATCTYIVGHKEEELRKQHLTQSQINGLKAQRAGQNARPFDEGLAQFHLRQGCESCQALIDN